jgi:chromosome segregation ATPase
LPALVQVKGHSFAQMRAVSNNPTQLRVAAYLKDAGDRIHSKDLSALSVREAYDPFRTVKKMINDMVVKLMEQAAEEQEHKGWCATELATIEQTRKEQTEAVEALHAEIDELEATIAQLSNEITELNQAIADSDKAMEEATQMRVTKKAKITKIIADAKAASEAVANALNVLQEFYAKAGQATALVQKKAMAGQPAIFVEAYTGMPSESGGVFGMIEVIQSDCADLESETTASEAAAAKEYSPFMSVSAADKASMPV